MLNEMMTLCTFVQGYGYREHAYFSCPISLPWNLDNWPLSKSVWKYKKGDYALPKLRIINVQYNTNFS